MFRTSPREVGLDAVAGSASVHGEGGTEREIPVFHESLGAL